MKPSWASSLLCHGQVLQQIGVDCIDESEVLTVADEGNHVNKTKFKALNIPKASGSTIGARIISFVALDCCSHMKEFLQTPRKIQQSPPRPEKSGQAPSPDA